LRGYWARLNPASAGSSERRDPCEKFLEISRWFLALWGMSRLLKPDQLFVGTADLSEVIHSNRTGCDVVPASAEEEDGNLEIRSELAEVEVEILRPTGREGCPCEGKR